MTLADAFGAHAHQDHEYRDQRRSGQQNGTGGPADGKDKDQHDQWCQSRQSQLGNIPGDEIVQSLHLLQDVAHQPTGGQGVQTHRPHGHQVGRKVIADPTPDGRAGLESGSLPPPGNDGLEGDNANQSDEQGGRAWLLKTLHKG